MVWVEEFHSDGLGASSVIQSEQDWVNVSTNLPSSRNYMKSCAAKPKSFYL